MQRGPATTLFRSSNDGQGQGTGGPTSESTTRDLYVLGAEETGIRRGLPMVIELHQLDSMEMTHDDDEFFRVIGRL